MATAAIKTNATLDQLKNMVCEHDKFIDGNGSLGAKTRLVLLEDSVERIEASISSMTHWFMGLIATICAGGLIWFLTTQLPKIAALK
jgi:hypothetical protein